MRSILQHQPFNLKALYKFRVEGILTWGFFITIIVVVAHFYLWWTSVIFVVDSQFYLWWSLSCTSCVISDAFVVASQCLCDGLPVVVVVVTQYYLW